MVLTDQPRSADDVSSTLIRAQVDNAVGLSAIRQLQKWRRNIFAALGVGQPLSEYQIALQNQWVGLPDWYGQRIPRNTTLTDSATITASSHVQEQREAPPRYMDPPQKWVSFYSRYQSAPLPRGLIRDTNGQVPLERAELHLMMIGIASPTTPLRRPHKTRVLDVLAALFAEPQVYDAHLNAANVVPATKLDIAPLPESQDPGTGNTIPTSMSVIAAHAARCGITREFVQNRLRAWARDYLASGSRSTDLGPTVTAAPHSIDAPSNMQTDAMGLPVTDQGSQTVPNVGGDDEAMAVEPIGRDSM